MSKRKFSNVGLGEALETQRTSKHGRHKRPARPNLLSERVRELGSNYRVCASNSMALRQRPRRKRTGGLLWSADFDRGVGPKDDNTSRKRFALLPAPTADAPPIALLSALADVEGELLCKVLAYVSTADFCALHATSRSMRRMLRDHRVTKPFLLDRMRVDVAHLTAQPMLPLSPTSPEAHILAMGITRAFRGSHHIANLRVGQIKDRFHLLRHKIAKVEQDATRAIDMVLAQDYVVGFWNVEDGNPPQHEMPAALMTACLSVLQKRIFATLDMVLKTPAPHAVQAWMRLASELTLRIASHNLHCQPSLRAVALHLCGGTVTGKSHKGHHYHPTSNPAPHRPARRCGLWLSIPWLGSSVARLRTPLAMALARWLVEAELSVKVADANFPLLTRHTTKHATCFPSAYDSEARPTGLSDHGVDNLAIILCKVAGAVGSETDTDTPRSLYPFEAQDCSDAADAHAAWWSIEDKDSPGFAEAIAAWAPPSVINDAPRKHVDMLFVALLRLVDAYAMHDVARPHITEVLCRLLLDAGARLIRDAEDDEDDDDDEWEIHVNDSDDDVRSLRAASHCTVESVVKALCVTAADHPALWLRRNATLGLLALIHDALADFSLLAVFVSDTAKHTDDTLSLFQAFVRIADDPTEKAALSTYREGIHESPIVVDSACLHAAIASLTFKFHCIVKM
jgi:hypothetical protein